MNELAINAGRLRHQISILSPVITEDATGAAIAWTPFATCRAAIEWGKQPTDVIRAGQTTSEKYLVVTTRYLAGVNEQMRVQAANGTYEIQAIENVLEQNAVLKLHCIALRSNQ